MSAELTFTGGDGVEIDPMIYGQYLEHVEDCVDPGLIGDEGLHPEVIEAARELGVPTIRWPGGSFADLYHWRDGIGPAEDRPLRRNWHWGGVESNRFGTHEFLSWCERVGAEPYLNVNLGTGTLIEALQWLDHCNGTLPTVDVAERRALGRDEPWQVRFWGIGNETWGHWEAGRMPAQAYADVLDNWANFFKTYDPELQIVAVGSRAGDDPSWDRTVLETAGRHIDLLSIHLYGVQINGSGDHASLIHSPAFVEKRINDMAQLVRAHNDRHSTRIGIALDEWNSRHHHRTANGHRLDRSDPRNGADAMFAAGVFHAMIRHADVVRMGNYVFLVNGNGVLRSSDGQVELSALAPIFRLYRHHLIGHQVDLTLSSPTVPTPPIASGHPGGWVHDELPDSLPGIDAVAARHEGQLRVAVINRTPDPVQLDIDSPVRDWVQVAVLTTDPDQDLTVDLDEDPHPWQGSLPPWSVSFLRSASEVSEDDAPGRR